MRHRVHAVKRRVAGAFYVEVLVAVAVLAVALVPAGNAIYNGLRANEALADATQQHYRLVSRMEQMMAEPFAALDAAGLAAGGPAAATTYSDPPGPERRLVFVARYDADNADADGDPFTGVEPDILWVRVEIEGTNRALESLVTL